MPTLQNLTIPSEILFLDFDGVLQTPAVAGWLEMELCDELITLLSQHPALGIVVTSSHREGRTVEDVKLLLPTEVARRVMALTEVQATGRAKGGRQREIETWLAENPSITRWVSVDDDKTLFQDGCPWAVFTHPQIGWDRATTAAVCTALAKSRRPRNLPKEGRGGPLR